MSSTWSGMWRQYINQKYAEPLGKRPITVVIIPTTRDGSGGGVAEGIGDIAVGNLTVTDARRQTVDFVTAPTASDVGGRPDRSQVAGHRHRG